MEEHIFCLKKKRKKMSSPLPLTQTTRESRESRESQLIAVQEEALSLFKKKNKDYGDSFADYGSVGVIVRLGDKIKRLSSITTRRKEETE